MPSGPTGPDLSSHDGLYELHGTDLTSDAQQFDKSMSRGDHPGTAGSGQRAALQNPPTGDPYIQSTVDTHTHTLQVQKKILYATTQVAHPYKCG